LIHGLLLRFLVVSALPFIAASGVALHHVTTIHTINPFHANTTHVMPSHPEPRINNTSIHAVSPNNTVTHTYPPPSHQWWKPMPPPRIPSPWIDNHG